MQNDKPLTIKDVQGVLIPAMEDIFITKQELRAFEKEMATKQDLKDLRHEFKQEMATKGELQSLKEEMREKFDTVLNRTDKILKELEIFKTERAVNYYQKQKERKM